MWDDEDSAERGSGISASVWSVVQHLDGDVPLRFNAGLNQANGQAGDVTVGNPQLQSENSAKDLKPEPDAGAYFPRGGLCACYVSVGMQIECLRP